MEELVDNGEESVGSKRKGNKDLWKRNLIKRARVNNKEFVDPQGNVIAHKKTTGNDCRQDIIVINYRIQNENLDRPWPI